MKKIAALLLALLLVLSLCGCTIEGDFGFSEPEWSDAETEAETENGTDLPTPEVPEPITKEYVAGIVSKEYTEPKNIILIIGDGMGANDIAVAERIAEGVYDFGLILNKIPNHGLAKTGSLDNEITDSAAAGTALATGNKTNNGIIGKTADGTDLTNVSEMARTAGKKVGIVTDDDLFGATPSAFVSHNISRQNYGELAMSMLNFAPEVMIGMSYDSFVNNLTEEGKTAFAEGYTIAQNLDAFSEMSAEAVSNGKRFAGFNGGCNTGVSDHLAISAKKALELLENENGFFLMIEGCGTDVFGHSNMTNGKLSSVVNLDRTVAEVLRFMDTHPDTLLIITSDHETGGVVMPVGVEPPDSSMFTTTAHTSADVRVFALGKGSEFFAEKTVDNTEIGSFIKNLLSGQTEKAE